MRADEASSVILLAFSVAIIYLSTKLGLGSLKFPGPGFITFWSGVILSILSMVVFLRSSTTTNEKGRKKVAQLLKEAKWSKAMGVFLLLVLYVLVFAHLGFLICTAVLLTILLRAVDPVRWIVAIGVGVLTSFVSFVIFDLLLKVQLPHGVIENFLFVRFLEFFK